MRRICQFLPDRPLTGLDTGCGTGRYTRLLRALLPDGSLLAASDVSAAMLASSGPATAATLWGWCRCCQPPNICRCGRQPGSGHRVQLRSPFRPRPVPGRRGQGAAARRPAVHLHPHPAAEHANDLGPLLPGFHRARAAPAHPGRDPRRRQADRRAHGDRHTDLQASALEHGRAAPGPGRGAPLPRPSPSTPRRSCARPSRPSWPGCPAPRSPGLTSTCWSSPAGATAARRSPRARAAWRAGRSPIRPSRSAPDAPARLPQDVLAAARRSPRYAPSRLLPRPPSARIELVAPGRRQPGRADRRGVPPAVVLRPGPYRRVPRRRGVLRRVRRRVLLPALAGLRHRVRPLSPRPWQEP